MILLDAPYLSDSLKTTIIEHDLPVVATPAASRGTSAQQILGRYHRQSLHSPKMPFI